jgi:hypothetical protein
MALSSTSSTHLYASYKEVLHHLFQNQWFVCKDAVMIKSLLVSLRITSLASLYSDVVTGIWIVNYDQSSPSDTWG